MVWTPVGEIISFTMDGEFKRWELLIGLWGSVINNSCHKLEVGERVWRGERMVVMVVMVRKGGVSAQETEPEKNTEIGSNHL